MKKLVKKYARKTCLFFHNCNFLTTYYVKLNGVLKERKMYCSKNRLMIGFTLNKLYTFQE